MPDNPHTDPNIDPSIDPRIDANNAPLCLDIDHEPELSDEDIIDAMQHIPGYLDISTEDFRTIYHLAWRHAIARLKGRAEGEAQ